jgi:hypothetical protein
MSGDLDQTGPRREGTLIAHPNMECQGEFAGDGHSRR